MAENSTENETSVNVGEDDGSLAVVFQCKQCNGIVGDNSAWICANQSLQVVCLSGMYVTQ